MSRKKAAKDYESESIWVGDCLIHKAAPCRKIFQDRHGKLPRHIEVCHMCDNPKCINDAHHFPGTRLFNAIDAQVKGRLKKSEASKKRMHSAFIALWKKPSYRRKMMKIYHTEECRQARSRVHKGKNKSDEHKSKIGAAHLGRHHTAKSKKQMSKSQIAAWAAGKYVSNIGKKRTPEQCARIAAAIQASYDRRRSA